MLVRVLKSNFLRLTISRGVDKFLCLSLFGCFPLRGKPFRLPHPFSSEQLSHIHPTFPNQISLKKWVARAFSAALIWVAIIVWIAIVAFFRTICSTNRWNYIYAYVNIFIWNQIPYAQLLDHFSHILTNFLNKRRDIFTFQATFHSSFFITRISEEREKSGTW